MNTLSDINIEDYKSTSDRVTISNKNPNPQQYTEIKCFKNFEDVAYIDARKINLIKIQKTVFLNLTNLKEIDLRDNKLHKISKKFLHFKHLKVLKLDDNLISYFPNYLASMQSLEQLTLSNNQIKNIPTSIQQMQNLKILKFSNNRVESIPIEFGLLKSLEVLHMDANYFTQIPTTLCYLKNVCELSLEWLEFTDPPLQKVIKENIGKTIITLIRNSLQEMIRQGVLYCDFHNFVSRNSIQGASIDSKSDTQIKFIHHAQNNSENTVEMQTNLIPVGKKLVKIFNAIENNYYGVIKSLIFANEDYIKIKNNDNKTPLYLTIHNNKFDLTKLLLSKIDFSMMNNSYTYLHKAIRMRDAALTCKLIEMGIDVNDTDDQGSTCFHILFSVFTKNFAKCSLIGDMLLRKNCKLNSLNNESWAPVHVASKRGAKECIHWIINQNKNLKKEGKDYFDLNLKGKNKCTPLHISVICFRLEETSLLLESGCDVFTKNQDGKSPRKVCYGNFLLSKLLRNYENNYLVSKFPCKSTQYAANNCMAPNESVLKYEDYFSSSMQSKADKKTPVLWEHQYNSLDINKRLFVNSNYNSCNRNNSAEKSFENDSENKKGLKKINSKDKLRNAKSNQPSKEIAKILRNPSIESEINVNNQQHIPNQKKSNSNLINLIPLPNSKKKLKNYNLKNYSPSLEQTTSKSKSIFDTHPLKSSNKINLHFHKGILLGSENSLAEKYESLMQLKLVSNSANHREVEKILELYLKEVDLDLKINLIILSDICDFIMAKHYSNLKKAIEEILNKTQTKKHFNFLNLQLKNTIHILNFVTETEYRFRLDSKRSESSSKIKRVRKDSNIELKRKYKTKSNFMIKDKSISNNYFSESKLIQSKKKVCHGADINDEYNCIEMNEKNGSKNNMKNYENQMPIRVLKDLGNILNLSDNNESCNVADSSFSLIKPEKSVDGVKDEFDNSECTEFNMNTKTFRVQRDNFISNDKLFSSIPPKKVDSIFFECDADFEMKITEKSDM